MAQKHRTLPPIGACNVPTQRIVIKGFYDHQLRTYLPSVVFLQSRRSDSYRYIYLKLYEFCGGSHAQDDHPTSAGSDFLSFLSKCKWFNGAYRLLHCDFIFIFGRYTEIILYNITSFYMLAVELYLLILTHT
ncbi:hypothetical protein GQX74_010334 [Glossina fuscipes]|nr:hypothetical protein GQX74_010334 [Glossina fuscipes]